MRDYKRQYNQLEVALTCFAVAMIIVGVLGALGLGT